MVAPFTLYVEVSLCQRTGAVGWGSLLVGAGGLLISGGGVIESRRCNGSTVAELVAMERAVLASMPFVGIGGSLRLATRSTAAMAVLRWVFPDRPQEGCLTVVPPKKLGDEFIDLDELFDMHDDIAVNKIDVILLMVGKSEETETAQKIARGNMERQRRELTQ